MRVLIVPDKFKGTLTAEAAAVAIAAGWRRKRPMDTLHQLPMTDGGDGFGAVLAPLLRAESEKFRTVDAAHRPIPAAYWRYKKTAIIDSAAIIGLAMLKPKQFHPFQLDTFGLGETMLAAMASGASALIIGVGGSATNDGGFGMARALGWKFLDAEGNELEQWWQLHALAKIQKPLNALQPAVTVAVDVENPLLGPRGCSRIYGPQKGLRPSDFPLAEKCLRRLAEVSKGNTAIKGAGAAGGLGFGLVTFTKGELKSGFEIFADHAKLDHQIRKSDLVITGEGAMDEQSFMGKGVGLVAQRCKKFKIPCIALAGKISDLSKSRVLFKTVYAITDTVSAEQARSEARRCLQKLAEEVASRTCN